jgi:hypothetical protein
MKYLGLYFHINAFYISVTWFLGLKTNMHLRTQFWEYVSRRDERCLS